MLIKGIIDCDLVNYKKPCLTIEMPKCNFKCDKECGMQVCQNSNLASAPTINIPRHKILSYYTSNPITKALCFQGLEPFDTFDDMFKLIVDFRRTLWINDDIDNSLLPFDIEAFLKSFCDIIKWRHMLALTMDNYCLGELGYEHIV